MILSFLTDPRPFIDSINEFLFPIPPFPSILSHRYEHARLLFVFLVYPCILFEASLFNILYKKTHTCRDNEIYFSLMRLMFR